MLRRWTKADDETATEVSPEPARPQREGAKNRPTPRRRDQEAARRKPLVQADPKAAKGADRAARREAAQRAREALRTGDEAHLPERDRGPVRRLARDVVDARFSLGEVLLPLMLLVLLVSFVLPRVSSSPQVQAWAANSFIAVYLLGLLAVLDAVLLARRVRREAAARFGEQAGTRGLGLYVASRAFQIRRTRLPRPAIPRGGTPR